MCRELVIAPAAGWLYRLVGRLSRPNWLRLIRPRFAKNSQDQRRGRGNDQGKARNLVARKAFSAGSLVNSTARP
jgi:hypothetical protein